MLSQAFIYWYQLSKYTSHPDMTEERAKRLEKLREDASYRKDIGRLVVSPEASPADGLLVAQSFDLEATYVGMNPYKHLIYQLSTK